MLAQIYGFRNPGPIQFMAPPQVLASPASGTVRASKRTRFEDGPDEEKTQQPREQPSAVTTQTDDSHICNVTITLALEQLGDDARVNEQDLDACIASQQAAVRMGD